jgi:hypothetical protein
MIWRSDDSEGKGFGMGGAGTEDGLTVGVDCNWKVEGGPAKTGRYELGAKLDCDE